MLYICTYVNEYISGYFGLTLTDFHSLHATCEFVNVNLHRDETILQSRFLVASGNYELI
jgi:hypothetical protein